MNTINILKFSYKCTFPNRKLDLKIYLQIIFISYTKFFGYIIIFNSFLISKFHIGREGGVNMALPLDF